MRAIGVKASMGDLTRVESLPTENSRELQIFTLEGSKWH